MKEGEWVGQDDLPGVEPCPGPGHPAAAASRLPLQPGAGQVDRVGLPHLVRNYTTQVAPQTEVSSILTQGATKVGWQASSLKTAVIIHCPLLPQPLSVSPMSRAV